MCPQIDGLQMNNQMERSLLLFSPSPRYPERLTAPSSSPPPVPPLLRQTLLAGGHSQFTSAAQAGELVGVEAASSPVLQSLLLLLLTILSRHLAVLQHAGELNDGQGRVDALQPIYRAHTMSTGNRLRLAVSHHLQCDEHDSLLLGWEDVERLLGGAGLLLALHRLDERSTPRLGGCGVTSWWSRTPACSLQT